MDQKLVSDQETKESTTGPVDAPVISKSGFGANAGAAAVTAPRPQDLDDTETGPVLTKEGSKVGYGAKAGA
jgi:hypothetical protein